MSASYGSIEVVRGRLSQERADELVRFWSREGVLDEATARDRLPEVVCVLRDGDGQIAGVNSVYPAPLGLVGGRTFWVYRNYVKRGGAEAFAEMAQRAFHALHAEFDPAVEGPLGICHLAGRDVPADRLSVVTWTYPAAHYVGYLDDGQQVRIRYFDGARVGRPRPAALPILAANHTYRVVPFADQHEVSAEEVAHFWEREGAVTEGEDIERRLSEVQVVATEPGGELIAVATAYLKHNAQLRMDMWYYREFVGAEHRTGGIGWSLALVGRDHLRQRYVGGQDTRASGIVYEVENEGLKEYLDFGVWPTPDFLFIGENERGDHVRVHYFPGAPAPRLSE